MANNLKMVSYVDLPPLEEGEIDKLLNWHDGRKTVMSNKGGQNLEFPWLWTQIRDIDLEGGVQHPGTLPGSGWNEDFLLNFPDLASYFNCLPMTDVTRIVLLETKKSVLPHVDLSSEYYDGHIFEPANFRMTLRNADGPGFFVQALPRDMWAIGPSTNNETQFSKDHFKAELGRWWVLNNYCCQHGSDFQPGDRKVLISVQGKISPRHLALLHRSEHLESINHPEMT